MASNLNTRSMTFRVENIPPGTTADELKLRFDPKDRPHIQVKTIVPAVDCYEKDVQDYTATIDFQSSDPSSKLPRLLDDDLSVDGDFHGFTPLNQPQEPIAADIIAVTGLAAHAFGSWAHSPRNMWLRDYLPRDVSNARVLTFGYPSQLQGNTSRSILSDHSTNLIHRLLTMRESAKCQNRPIIFIGHSLGCLIIKKALCDVNGSIGIYSSRLPVRSIIFLGAPHKGLEIKALETLVKTQPGEDIIRELKAESPTLTELNDKFRFVAKDIDILTCYEMIPTRTAIEMPDGSWKREGPPEMMVSLDSARIWYPREQLVACNSDHSQIAKLKRGENSIYPSVKWAIKQGMLSAGDLYSEANGHLSGNKTNAAKKTKNQYTVSSDEESHTQPQDRMDALNLIPDDLDRTVSESRIDSVDSGDSDNHPVPSPSILVYPKSTPLDQQRLICSTESLTLISTDRETDHEPSRDTPENVSSTFQTAMHSSEDPSEQNDHGFHQISLQLLRESAFSNQDDSESFSDPRSKSPLGAEDNCAKIPCESCSEELDEFKMLVCTKCDACSVCERCYPKFKPDHDSTHTFESISKPSILPGNVQAGIESKLANREHQVDSNSGDDTQEDVTNFYNCHVAIPAASRDELVVAIRLGDEAGMLAQLMAGIDINQEIEIDYGRSPLLTAVRYRQEHLVRLLLDQGAFTRTKDKRGWTTLHYLATPEGLYEQPETSLSDSLIDLLLNDRPPLNELSEMKTTPLMHAAQAGKISLVMRLLKHGANVLSVDSDGANALHYAASTCRNAKILKVLIEEGIPVDTRIMKGSKHTALHLAAKAKGESDKAIAYLIQAGADINAPHFSVEFTGATALHIAVAHGTPAAVQQLLESGANVKDRSSYSKDSPTSLCLALVSTEIAHRDEIVRLLLQAGADVNAFSYGCTPLMEAASSNLTSCAGHLLRAGADIDAQKQDGSTPLHLASSNGHLEMVKFLLESGANPCVRTCFPFFLKPSSTINLRYILPSEERDKYRSVLKDAEIAWKAKKKIKSN